MGVSWFGSEKTPGRTVGRVLDILHCYAPLHVVEECSVGDGKVSYRYSEEPFATFVWEDCTDFPIFTFVGYGKDVYNENQKRRMEDAKQDYPPRNLLKLEEENSKRLLSSLNRARFFIALSVEGFEEETDIEKLKQRIKSAMKTADEILRGKHSQNNEG